MAMAPDKLWGVQSSSGECIESCLGGGRGRGGGGGGGARVL